MTIHERLRATFGFETSLVLMIVLSLLLTARSGAQVAGATLSGSVIDPSGAAIPNATVSIKNIGNGEVREAASNSDGFYSAPNLLPGAYEVSVSTKGFSKAVQSGITLT